MARNPKIRALNFCRTHTKMKIKIKKEFMQKPTFSMLGKTVNFWEIDDPERARDLT